MNKFFSMPRFSYHAFFSLFLIPAVFAGAEVLTIDFADDQGAMAYRGSGFLVGINATQPADSLIAPLKPQLMRNDVNLSLSTYTRNKQFGAKAQMVLRLNSGTLLPLPGTNNDWSAWETHVRTTVSNTLTAGQDFEFDVWNEPDAAMFWDGTIPQFYETWRRAVVIIRSLNPNAVVVGPSISGFNFTWLKNFLQYAKTNNVLPTAVCWHEIGVNAGIRGIALNVQSMRSYLAAQGMDVPKVYINEMTSSTNHHNPGLIVRHFAEIERAKVDGACKSCWNETVGSNCNNRSLDGLLTNGTRLPRSGWWAYKSYADITGRMVGVIPNATPFTVDGVAGRDAAKGEARAVLGRYAGSGSLDVKLINLESVSYLTGAGTIHVTAKRIPNSGESQLASPVTEINADFAVSNNILQFTIPNFPDSNAYAIQLTPGGTSGITETRKQTAGPTWEVLRAANAGIMVKATQIAAGELVSISIHDVRGRLIHRLSGVSNSGEFSTTWDASAQSPGVYVFRLETGDRVDQKEVVVIR